MAKKPVLQYLPHRPKVGAVVPFRDVREGQWFTSGPADRRPWLMDGGRAVRRLQFWGESARFAADHYVKVVRVKVVRRP